MKGYRISLFSISIFMMAGIFLSTMTLLFIPDILEHPFQFIGLLLFAAGIDWYAYYLWRLRKTWQGYRWDGEGVIIDERENKVYWYEIESIQYMKSQNLQSTVIYPHYTYHEKIRERRNKKLPATAHPIDWLLIEKPKEFHEKLMQAWEEKQIEHKRRTV